MVLEEEKERVITLLKKYNVKELTSIPNRNTSGLFIRIEQIEKKPTYYELTFKVLLISKTMQNSLLELNMSMTESILETLETDKKRNSHTKVISYSPISISKENDIMLYELIFITRTKGK